MEVEFSLRFSNNIGFLKININFLKIDVNELVLTSIFLKINVINKLELFTSMSMHFC